MPSQESPIHPLVHIESPAFKDMVEVRAIDGFERLSAPFEFSVHAVCHNPSGMDPNELVGAKVNLIMRRGEQEVRRIHGIIGECHDLLLTEPSHTEYQLRIVPRLWVASLVETLEIYLDMSVRDIVAQKLSLLGLGEGEDFEFRLTKDYPTRDFVVQYKETDLAFLSRLTEHWGIAYFFEHRDGNDVVVFSDDNSGYPAVLPEGRASYHGRGEQQGIYRLTSRTRMIPSVYVQRDYNYRNPSTDLTATTNVPDGFGGGVIEYGNHFKTVDEADWFVGMRAEERRAGRYVFEGTGELPELMGGATVQLEGHPGGDLHLLLTEVRHHAEQGALGMGRKEDIPYENTFTAITAATPFRPPRITTKPRIHGVLTGVVDAEARGQYAELDEEGRYRVQFLFDTSGAGEGKASSCCRMMQPHAGAGYGMHFPLRPGTEVLLTFVDGDPDRPIIAGTVPNPQTASPVVASNLERNVIRTGGGNEINIDDTDGSQRIKLTTPHANTTFQLGSPNAPETGAVLTTTGASSTVASTGVANISSFDGMLAAIGAFRSGGSISSVAEKPGPWATILMGVGLVEALAGEAATILGLVKDAWAVVLAGLETEQALAAAELNQATDDCLATDKAEEDARKALLGDPVPPDKAALEAALDDYDAAVADRDAKYDELKTLKEERDAAGHDDMTATYDAKVAEIGVAHASTTDKSGSGKEAEVQEAGWAIDGTEPPAGDKKKKVIDELAKLSNQSEAAAYLATFDAKADHKTALDTATEKNDRLTRRLDDQKWKNESGPGAQGIAVADQVLEGIQTLTGLYSAVVALIGTVKDLFSKLKEEAEYGQAAMSFNDVRPTGTDNAKAAGIGLGIKPEKTRHELGSTGNLTVHADKRAFVRSPTLVISAMTALEEKTAIAAVLTNAALKLPVPTLKAPAVDGTLALLAEKNAFLLSKDKVEVSAKTKTVLSSQAALELLTQAAPAAPTKLVPNPVRPDPTVKVDALVAGELNQFAKEKVLLKTSDDHKLELGETAKLITMQSKDKISVEAATEAKLFVSNTALKLTAGTAEMLSNTGKMLLRLKETSAQLGVKDSHLLIKDNMARLKNSSSMLGLKASGGILKSAKVTVKGTASVKLDAPQIQIKGDVVKLG